MSREPYTHVNMCLRPGTAPYVGLSLYTSRVHLYNLLVEGRPVLDLTSADAVVSISTTGAGPVTDQDLRFARQLHQATARYLADCERLHANQNASQHTDDATSKATDQTAA
ncbi:hypothetical protein [Nonomuraea rhizosphaerae]|uniref:hypothetical protein n=1 Tax=Nonomuraea rhizosphaerae TaxID=2665663 RepID=UPI001C5E2A0B|nr:hypothetical protein [Nonomuraea rhizosphaerae]